MMAAPPYAGPGVVVIIPARDRAASLARCLAALDIAVRNLDGGALVVVADNGSELETECLLLAWRSADPEGRHVVKVTAPGRARALNAVLATVGAPLLIFFDDDMLVASDCLRVLVDFAERHPGFAAGCGTALLLMRFTTGSCRS